MASLPLPAIVSYVVALFLGIGIHEFAHCKFADMAGDPTPRYYGRVTLNLFKHFEPVGTIMMVLSAFAGVGIGWGRPAPMDPNKMRNPRWDFFVAVAAGPISNLCQAIAYAFVFRMLAPHPTLLGASESVGEFMMFLTIGVYVNLTLFFFNLIPFGPLDGHWLLGLLLPEQPRLKWFLFNQRVGFIGLIAFVLVLRYVPQSINEKIEAPVIWMFHFLLPKA